MNPSTKETKNAFVQVEKDVVTVLQIPESDKILFSASTDTPKIKPQQRTATKPTTQEEIIPPKPKFDMGMEEYDKLQEIYRQLVKPENTVLPVKKK